MVEEYQEHTGDYYKYYGQDRNINNDICVQPGIVFTMQDNGMGIP
jgi:hypothetical protein